jgi:hypothetical protein
LELREKTIFKRGKTGALDGSTGSKSESSTQRTKGLGHRDHRGGKGVTLAKSLSGQHEWREREKRKSRSFASLRMTKCGRSEALIKVRCREKRMTT